MSGTVNISRGIWHDTAFKAEPFTEREAFMWIIMEASYKAREKRVGNLTVSLARGQLATSVRFMCDAWGWSKSRVDRFLKRLENRDMIGTDSGTGINVITVCKYNDYQNEVGQTGTVSFEKRDSSGTAAGQQRDKPNKGLIPDAIQEQLLEPNGSLSSSDDVPAPIPADDVAEAVAAYNEAAARQGWPKVQKLTPSRRQNLKARLRDAGGCTGWEHALAKAEASDFICGRGPKVWSSFGFDALVSASKFTRLMAGSYDNRNPNNPNGNTGHGRHGNGGIGRGTVDAFASVAEKLARGGSISTDLD